MDYLGNIVVALLSALIGTYCGSFFLSKRQESKMKKVRNVAIRAISIIKTYGRRKGSYDQASSEFNAKMNIAEKRTIVVALHKLGIPILPPQLGAFDIRTIQFAVLPIDNDLLEDVILQISQGQCDHLFFEDPDKYFSENQRTFALRNIAKKFVKEVLTKSTYNPSEGKIYYPDSWQDFSWGEMKAISVFKEQVASNIYFGSDGKAVSSKMLTLQSEIEVGLWDIYLNWSYEAYSNLIMTTDLNKNMIQLSQKAFGGNMVGAIPSSNE